MRNVELDQFETRFIFKNDVIVTCRIKGFIINDRIVSIQLRSLLSISFHFEFVGILSNCVLQIFTVFIHVFNTTGIKRTYC